MEGFRKLRERLGKNRGQTQDKDGHGSGSTKDGSITAPHVAGTASGTTARDHETFIKDTKAFEREAIQNLGPTIPLQLRLQYATQSGFLIFLKKTKLDDPREVWSTVQDLCNPSTAPEGRQLGFQFMAALIQGQGNDLGLLRSDFFHTLKKCNQSQDFVWALDTLTMLTNGGRDLHGFEPELGPLLVTWALNPDPNFLMELLSFLVDLVKFSVLSFSEETLVRLIEIVCNMCNQTGQKHHDGIITFCLGFFDVVVRYGTLPARMVTLYTCTLCRTVNINDFCMPTWSIMRNLLKSQRGYQTMMTLCVLLDNTRKGVPKDGMVSLIRGAIFFIGMACWGSSRITSVQFSFAAILPSFLNAMSCKSETISYEIVLSVRRLVKKFGAQLWIEWSVLLKILSLCVGYVQRDPKSNLARILHETIDDLEALEDKGQFRGEKQQLQQLLLDFKPFRPEASVLRLIKSRRELLHPATGNWIDSVNKFMNSFYVKERRTAVRLEALAQVRELLRVCRYYREADMLSTVLHYLRNVATDADQAVARSGLELVIECARTAHRPEHMDSMVSVLTNSLSSRTRGPVNNDIDLMVVTGLVSIFATQFSSTLSVPPHVPQILSVFDVLLEALNYSSVEVRKMVIEALSSLSATQHYQVMLSEHINPFFIVAPKLEIASPAPTTTHAAAAAAAAAAAPAAGNTVTINDARARTKSHGGGTQRSPRLPRSHRSTPRLTESPGSTSVLAASPSDNNYSKTIQHTPPQSPRRGPHHSSNVSHDHGHGREKSGTFTPASIEKGFKAPSSAERVSPSRASASSNSPISPKTPPSDRKSHSHDRNAMSKLLKEARDAAFLGSSDQDSNSGRSPEGAVAPDPATGDASAGDLETSGSIKRTLSEPDIPAAVRSGKQRSSTFTSGLARELAKSPVPRGPMAGSTISGGTDGSTGQRGTATGTATGTGLGGTVGTASTATPASVHSVDSVTSIPGAANSQSGGASHLGDRRASGAATEEAGVEGRGDVASPSIQLACGRLPVHSLIERFVERLTKETDPELFEEIIVALFKFTDNVYIMRGVRFDRVVDTLCSLIADGKIANIDFTGLKDMSSRDQMEAYTRQICGGYQLLMKLIGYRRLMSGSSLNKLVRTFLRGLQVSSGQTGQQPIKPAIVVCLVALSRCTAELPEIIEESISDILDLLMNIDPKLGGSVTVTILNLLHDILNISGFVLRLSDEDFSAIINVLLPFVDPDRTTPQFTNLNFQLLMAWFLSSPLPLRPRLAKAIIQTLHRHMQVARENKTPDTLAGGVVELTLRGAYSDIKLTTTVFESDNKVFDTGISRTWLHGHVVTTVRLGSNGWIERIDRGITGTVVQHIFIANEARSPQNDNAWALGIKLPHAPALNIESWPASIKTAIAREFARNSKESAALLAEIEKQHAGIDSRHGHEDGLRLGASATPSNSPGVLARPSPADAASSDGAARQNATAIERKGKGGNRRGKVPLNIDPTPVVEASQLGTTSPIGIVRQRPPASPRDFVATDMRSSRTLFPPESPDWSDMRDRATGPSAGVNSGLGPNRSRTESSSRTGDKGTATTADSSKTSTQTESEAVRPSVSVSDLDSVSDDVSTGNERDDDAELGTSHSRSVAVGPGSKTVQPAGPAAPKPPLSGDKGEPPSRGHAATKKTRISAPQKQGSSTTTSAAAAAALSRSHSGGQLASHGHRRSSSCGEQVILPGGRESFESSASMTTPPYSPGFPSKGATPSRSHNRRRSMGDINQRAAVIAKLSKPKDSGDGPDYQLEGTLAARPSDLVADSLVGETSGVSAAQPRPAPTGGALGPNSTSGSIAERTRRHLDPSIEVLPALRLKFVPDAPILLPHSDSLDRALKVLDHCPCVHTCKVGVVYVGPGQNGNEQAILSNTQGSPKYSRFLSHLGSFHKLTDIPAGVYTGGLDRSPDAIDGEYALLWSDPITQCVFHVTTHMPTSTTDVWQVAKKRHIGNDYVQIIFNDSDSEYSADTIPGEFNFVHIVVHPLTAGASAGYRVEVKTKPGLPQFGPLNGTSVVTGRALAPLVRQTALHAYISCLHHVKQENAMQATLSNWDERRQQIERIKDRVDPRAPPPDELMLFLAKSAAGAVSKSVGIQPTTP